jgi:ubiquinone/menaquinone biosynthesis C-methylase UbiE
MRGKSELENLYRQREGFYDLSADLYHLIGFREYECRKQAVEALNIKTGDSVVEIGCGTGLNFSLYQTLRGQSRTFGQAPTGIHQKVPDRAVIH